MPNAWDNLIQLGHEVTGSESQVASSDLARYDEREIGQLTAGSEMEAVGDFDSAEQDNTKRNIQLDATISAHLSWIYCDHEVFLTRKMCSYQSWIMSW